MGYFLSGVALGAILSLPLVSAMPNIAIEAFKRAYSEGLFALVLCILFNGIYMVLNPIVAGIALLYFNPIEAVGFLVSFVLLHLYWRSESEPHKDIVYSGSVGSQKSERSRPVSNERKIFTTKKSRDEIILEHLKANVTGGSEGVATRMSVSGPYSALCPKCQKLSTIFIDELPEAVMCHCCGEIYNTKFVKW